MKSKLSDFTSVWFMDFEFGASPGERPDPHCLVARELHTGRQIRIWLEGPEKSRPPFDVGPDSLFVAYYASAELGCFLVLDWSMPIYVLDLFCEFRCRCNGAKPPGGFGLLGALTHFGLDCLSAARKEGMRALSMRGGPFLSTERQALLDYCQTDVDALVRLFAQMESRIDFPRALLRGRYMCSVAAMEHLGIPIDTSTLEVLRESWPQIRLELVQRVDPLGEVYDGTVFKRDRWSSYIQRRGIPWDRLDSGRLDLSDQVFKKMALRYPDDLGKWRELRRTLNDLRLESLAIGKDGRNRCLLSPFQSKTGRNQPSTSKFIFGAAKWLRRLIQPPKDTAIAYLDWRQQEFGIAAALSGDKRMQEAYLNGDPYLSFAKQAGAVPESATKESHKSERNLFKACVLGVQYGMSDSTLANSINRGIDEARRLLQLHRQTYSDFWVWRQGAIDHAMLYGYLDTVFGWRLRVPTDANPRSLANYPCQANGAEMLRLACSIMTERGIAVCAPIHDAVLIEGPVDRIDSVVAEAQIAMQQASEIVLDGFRLATETSITRSPDRFCEENGVVMWHEISSILREKGLKI